MTFLFSDIARVSKGNKKDFKPNALTKALADKRGAKDVINDDKQLSKKVKNICGFLPWVV